MGTNLSMRTSGKKLMKVIDAGQAVNPGLLWVSAGDTVAAAGVIVA
jgi:hypothetical protein